MRGFGIEVVTRGHHKAVRVRLAGDEPVNVDMQDFGELGELDGGECALAVERARELLSRQADLDGHLSLRHSSWDAVGDAATDVIYGHR